MARVWRQPVIVIDPAIESHYGTGYERSHLFPNGRPSVEPSLMGFSDHLIGAATRP
jgi:hypothetical protein